MATLSSAPVPISSIWSNGLFAWPAQSSNHRRALHIQHAYIGTLQTKNCLHWHHKWNVPPNPNRQKSNRPTDAVLAFFFVHTAHTHTQCELFLVAVPRDWCGRNMYMVQSICGSCLALIAECMQTHTQTRYQLKHRRAHAFVAQQARIAQRWWVEQTQIIKKVLIER